MADYEQYLRTSQPSQLWVTPRGAAPVLLDGPRLMNDTLVGFVRGQYREFAPGDLQVVQVRRPASGRTAFLATALITAGVVLIAALASGGSPSAPPNPEQPPSSSHP